MPEIKHEHTNKVINVSELVKNVDVPFFFTNGFQCGFTFADAHVVFKSHEVPVAVVNMGLPAIKTLHEQLGLILSTYTKNTGLQVSSLEEIASTFNKHIPK